MMSGLNCKLMLISGEVLPGYFYGKPLKPRQLLRSQAGSKGKSEEERIGTGTRSKAELKRS